MKKLLSVFAFALLATPTLAHALSFEVAGKCGETIAKAEVTDYAATTVFQVTTKLLTKAGIKFQANSDGNYLSSIAGLGEAETTVAGEERLWGWNFQVGDNKDIKDAPTDVTVTTKDSVKWVYGYIRMDQGKTKCLPNEQCPFTAAAPADCEKKAEEPKAPVAKDSPATTDSPAATDAPASDEAPDADATPAEAPATDQVPSAE